MSRLTPVLGLTAALLGPLASQAGAQSRSRVGAVPASIGGNMGLNPGSAGQGSALTGGVPLGATGFNSPEFLTVGTLDRQLGLLGDNPDPRTYLGTIERGLALSESNPNSPDALSSRIIARALVNPGGVSTLESRMRSVNPEFGGSAAAKLRGMAAEMRLASMSDTGLLSRLKELAAKLETADRLAWTAAGAAPGMREINEFFTGGFAQGQDAALAQAPAVATDQAGFAPLPQGYAHLMPAVFPAGPVRSAQDVENLPWAGLRFTANVPDAQAAFQEIRREAVRDPAFEGLVRQAASRRPDLALDPNRALLVRPGRPQLLRLLLPGDAIHDGARGFSLTLTDAARRLPLLIVSAPEGRATIADIERELLKAIAAAVPADSRLPGLSAAAFSLAPTGLKKPSSRPEASSVPAAARLRMRLAAAASRLSPTGASLRLSEILRRVSEALFQPSWTLHTASAR